MDRSGRIVAVKSADEYRAAVNAVLVRNNNYMEGSMVAARISRQGRFVHDTLFVPLFVGAIAAFLTEPAPAPQVHQLTSRASVVLLPVRIPTP